MRQLTSAVWWKAAVFRALRTMIVIATPYVPTVLYQDNYALIFSAVGFAGVASLVTSLFGIAETSTGAVSWYWALAERVIKTAAQSLLTLFGTATLFSDVQWTEAPQLIGTAVLGSLLLAFMKGLPEADTPLANASVKTATVNDKGEAEVAAVPVVAQVDAGTVTQDIAVDTHNGRDG